MRRFICILFLVMTFVSPRPSDGSNANTWSCRHRGSVAGPPCPGMAFVVLTGGTDSSPRDPATRLRPRAPPPNGLVQERCEPVVVCGDQRVDPAVPALAKRALGRP